MNDQNWLNFTQSGKVEDYLKYIEKKELKQDEYRDQGFSNQRTDNWGE